MSEERFSTLANLALEGIAIHDKGVILDANKTFAKQLGYEVSELIGRNGIELTAPEHRKAVAEHIMSGSEEPFETVALRKDGSTFPTLVIAKNVELKGRAVRVAAFRDISERERA
ncbi:MAG: PAS domain S-box protein [Candidatus Heimdallarchaeota archaeon]